VLSFRGEGEFFAEHDLQGVDEVRIELPSTPLIVRGCDPAATQTCPTLLSYAGSWVSTAGTPGDAEDHATQPSLVFEREDGFSALRAVVPLSVRGLVDLQMQEFVLPGDRDLDLRTSVGDVDVVGVSASIAVDIDAGDVSIRGGAGGIAVRTDHGDLDIESDGHADVRTSAGFVSVVQTGDARDLFVTTDDGGIHVELADDADVDLSISAPGTIRVATANIATITSGRFERRTGTGAIVVQLTTARGGVEVVAAPR
jgi:hypothetical protein